MVFTQKTSKLRRHLGFASLMLGMALLETAPAYAKSWFISLTGIGGLYSQNQDDWNVMMGDNGGDLFDKKTALFYGGQLEFYTLSFPARFTLGVRYEMLDEQTSGGGATAKNRAHLISLIDTFYFLNFKDGLNVFIRIGAGYLTASGSYNVTGTNSSLEFDGNYFTGSATAGLEVLFWRVALSIEAGYRYALIPKTTVTSASGTSFSGINAGDTLMLVHGGSSKKFTLNYSGVYYAANLKFYF